MWQKFHQQCIAQQINSQASNWNTGNILLIESTRSYPTIPPSRSFAEIRVVLPVLVSLVAWLLLHLRRLLICGKAGGGWMVLAGDGEGQCSAAPRVFTQLLLAQLRWAAPESREQHRRADLNCDRWRRAASPVPALPPPRHTYPDAQYAIYWTFVCLYFLVTI